MSCLQEAIRVALTQLSAPLAFIGADNYFVSVATVSAALWIAGVLAAQYLRDYGASMPIALDKALELLKSNSQKSEAFATAANAHLKFAVAQNRSVLTTYFSALQLCIAIALAALFPALPGAILRLVGVWFSYLHIIQSKRISQSAAARRSEIASVQTLPLCPPWFAPFNRYLEERPKWLRPATDYLVLATFLAMAIFPAAATAVLFHYLPLILLSLSTGMILDAIVRLTELTPLLNRLRYVEDTFS